MSGAESTGIELPSWEKHIFSGYAGPGSSTAHGMAARSLPAPVAASVAEGKISFYQGKVRDSFTLDDRIIMVTSDRVSAFDRILDLIPFKGEVLNRISAYWFKATSDIIENHLLETPGSRTVVARSARVLPVEMVVRGYLTGSAWRDYSAGRAVSGIVLPPGMQQDQAFETPVITPSTKAEVGSHDEPVSSTELIRRGIVSAGLWSELETAALALFRRGQELAGRQGLILVDTKYEFGLVDGKLILVDELHTPDSSRYWYAEGYEERFRSSQPQKGLDKEYLRRWLMDRGFSGYGDAPVIPLEVKLELARKYIQAYELICGEKFASLLPDAEAEYKLIESLF